MSDTDHRSRLRVIVDANVLLSFLINRGRVSTTIGQVVTIALGARFRIIVPNPLLTELRNAPFKRKLRGQVSADEIHAFTAWMLDEGIGPVSVVPIALPVAGRDPNDRYLLEAAIQNDVDILVSGDKDLLALAEFLELPRIMSPADFVAEFGEDS